ncbi:unnamed protein product [Heligmosomoides polygyrus]|uniref:VASt domain-containing protein n=1 Tax=Heligmosomoides polygyrus TaxID=6339 RepID=A0A183FNR5_HELPZ|nr:unnamed protein product [Heligmosomoides polygyrus]
MWVNEVPSDGDKSTSITPRAEVGNVLGTSTASLGTVADMFGTSTESPCTFGDVFGSLLSRQARSRTEIMREKWTINSDLMFQYVSDVEFVANVWVEGEDAPLIGDGFTLTTTKEILENADATTFLTQNDLLKHSSLTADGLSIRFQVGFSCALRRGVEGEDLKNGAEKFTARLEQLSFANVEKGLLLHKEMNTAEMQKQQKSFDELSRGALQYTDSVEVAANSSATDERLDKPDPAADPSTPPKAPRSANSHRTTTNDERSQTHDPGRDSNMIRLTSPVKN